MLCTEPLTMAQENNHDECARLLLSSGAKPKHTYFLGYEMKLVHLENLKGPLTKAAELVKRVIIHFLCHLKTLKDGVKI